MTTRSPKPRSAAIVRKHLGYAHIPGRFATSVNDFTLAVLSPYVNYHTGLASSQVLPSTPRVGSVGSITTEI